MAVNNLVGALSMTTFSFGDLTTNVYIGMF